MSNLILSEIKRFWFRRMTRFFPLILALLIAAGVAIAYFVINASDEPWVDFVNDIGGTDARDTIGPLAILLPLMAFVIGSSYIGADLKTGMFEQLLTWEPRRNRHVMARSVSAFTGCFVLAVLLCALLVGLFYGLASQLGTTEGMDSEYWGWIGMSIVRTSVAVGLFAVLGMGITWIANSSVGSIVGFLIYWFVIENLVGAFLPKIAVWAPIVNGASFSSAHDVERVDGSVFSGDFDLLVHHSYSMAGLILLAWTALAIGAGAFVFNKRDVA